VKGHAAFTACVRREGMFRGARIFADVLHLAGEAFLRVRIFRIIAEQGGRIFTVCRSRGVDHHTFHPFFFQIHQEFSARVLGLRCFAA